MTISHVIYLEFARLIVSWQWVTEVVITQFKERFIHMSVNFDLSSETSQQ